MAVLQLKNDTGTEGGRCPSCGAVMPSGAIICIECGYDTRSGRKHEVLEKPDNKRWLMLAAVAVGVIVLGVVARFVWAPKSDSVASLPPPVVESAPPAPAPLAVPSAPTTSVAIAEAAAEPAVAAEPPPPDPEQIAAEQRPLMEAELNRVAPMFEEGQEADLRLMRGLVVRGVVVSRSETNVVLVDEDTGTNAVEFVAIDPRSRVRVDPAYRAQYLDARLRQVVARRIADATNGVSESP